MAELTVRHREMLEFEAQWWRHDVDRETAIRQLFGLSPARYEQILKVIVEWPSAVAYSPLVVRRLRRAHANARSRPSTGRRLRNG
jgi:hypothetical protein